jgi:hypothetical protein
VRHVREARDDHVERRVAARAADSAWRRQTAAVRPCNVPVSSSALRPGRSWPPGRLREAWVVYHYGTEIRDDWLTPHSGPERVGDHGAGDAGPRGRGQHRRAAHRDRPLLHNADHQPPPTHGLGRRRTEVLAFAACPRDPTS